AVPIAVLSNVTRITVTGVLHKVAGGEVADYVFHDLAGWLMMPLALGLLWLEMRLLGWGIRTRQGEGSDDLGPGLLGAGSGTPAGQADPDKWQEAVGAGS